MKLTEKTKEELKKHASWFIGCKYAIPKTACQTKRSVRLSSDETIVFPFENNVNHRIIEKEFQKRRCKSVFSKYNEYSGVEYLMFDISRINEENGKKLLEFMEVLEKTQCIDDGLIEKVKFDIVYEKVNYMFVAYGIETLEMDIKKNVNDVARYLIENDLIAIDGTFVGISLDALHEACSALDISIPLYEEF